MSLPKITLRIKEKPEQFLLRMDSILKEEVKSGKAKMTVKSELNLHSDLVGIVFTSLFSPAANISLL